MITQFELNILDAIQNFLKTPFFDEVWKYITYLGDFGLLWFLLSLSLLIFKETRRVGIICLVSLLLGALFTNVVLKTLIARPRPFTHTTINLLINTPRDSSFPSGHTTSAFAFAFVLLRERFKVGKVNIYAISLVLAGLVAFSRLYLYVHFPTDILAGIIIAFGCAYLAPKLYEYFKF
jgi:undecaprenyl-diphosphatase